MSGSDHDAQRLEILEHWENAAAGWGKRAERVRELGLPVSMWMIEQLALQPGQRVLELAAGPGDTGFLAAELIRPGGTLVCSDAAEAMLDIARARAGELNIENVEFSRLELEWIDLPAASVDAILCRWGVMLSVDPGAAMAEMRRVVRPGGRTTLAVWDDSSGNPWATIPGRALLTLGHAEPPDPDAPGMFALAAPGRLQEMLESAGFVEVRVEAVEIERRHPSLDEYLAETLDLSPAFADTFLGLPEPQQTEVRDQIASLATPFLQPDGSIVLPGSSLVALANG